MLSPRQLAAGARFVAALPGYHRHPLDPASATAAVRRRLGNREAALVGLLETALATARNPVGALLRHAGLDAADAAALVRAEGVEGALRRLFRSGVYLTVDEFKGRREIVRGSLRVTAGPERLRNPRSTFHVPVASSGSRSQGTATLLDLAFIRACAADACAALAARGGSSWRKATWEVPGAGARFRLLKYAAFGDPPVRWFSQLDPRLPGQHPVIRLATAATRWGSLAAGVPLPAPELVLPGEPGPALAWIGDELRRGHVPHLFTFPSCAVALCDAAARRGVDLTGARFTLGGEPITAARLASIRRVGGDAQPRYGSIECGPIGYGCLAPSHPDEVHVVADLHALLLAGDDNAARLPGDAVLVTGLHPRAPFTLVNASMGDRATLSGRACGCPLGELGWAAHLHQVRSFEKLTGAGMTFLSSDVIRVLEVVLPARFGGGPTAYQLVEDEDRDGRAVLVLVVDPSVGELDADAVTGAFLAALAAASPADRLMAATLGAAGVLRVERRTPLTTRSGKQLHLALSGRA